MKGQQLVSDRFIACRSRSVASSLLDRVSTPSSNQTRLLASSLQKQLHPTNKYVCSKTISTKQETLKTFLGNITTSYRKLPIIQEPQKIKSYKILDASGLIDQFYSNVLDWSKTGFISIGLSSQLCLHHEATQQIIQYTRQYNTQITSTKFSQQGQLICCGDNQGHVEMFDTQKNKIVRLYRAHKGRIPCMDFTPSNLFITGSQDKSVHLHDLRFSQPIVAELKSHRGQVCGLSFKDHYLASGGNDNKVSIWDLRMGQQISKHSYHSGAVKAISWCPYKNNILISAGGMEDKKIVVWNSITEKKQMEINQKTSIQAIAWRNSTREMITAQGDSKGYLLTHNTFLQKKLRRKKFIGYQRILGLRVHKTQDNLMCSIGVGYSQNGEINQRIRYWNFDENRKNEVKVIQEDKLAPSNPIQVVGQNQSFVNLSTILR